MADSISLKEKTYRLIDELKATCQKFGMGNDGNEYKIITQVFLYKFLNDKFGYELRKISSEVAEAEHWEDAYEAESDDDRAMQKILLGANVMTFEPNQLLRNLFNRSTEEDFDHTFDDTMTQIANDNLDTFSTLTVDGERLPIFERLTTLVDEVSERPKFARALVDKLVNFNFDEAFGEHYDFFSDIFEYLISDYNTNGGGKYAEYYTPKAIARIMARLLVGDDNSDLHNIECYDPSAGTGTLLLALSHQISEDKCTIFSQDISQRSNKMLKLNLMLNGLISSLPHAIKGDTLVSPFHKSDDGSHLRTFDFVVSNPPFKMDFSDTRESIASQGAMRFWAGVPKIPGKKKESMAIYTCFIQHVINSIRPDGKGAIVVPTGFITAKSGVEAAIIKKIVDEKVVWGVVSMPSNVFANTGTNVSVLFFDNSRKRERVVLMDASKLGEDYKDPSGLKKHRLTDAEIEQIIGTFRREEAVENFSVVVSYDEVKEKGYSLSAGQYFDIKIDYVDITEEEFNKRITDFKQTLSQQFAESHKLEKEIMAQLDSLVFNPGVGRR